MRAPTPSCWFLVAVIAIMVVGHVCASPFHAHAGAIATHEEHDSHHGSDDADHDAIHAGSCEALKSAGAALDAVVLVPVGPATVLIERRADRPTAGEPATVSGSPPLFLLHAALLI
jgi:hypothetical protein